MYESCKKAGGIVGCPADAADAVKRIVDYVSLYNGGEGAVRDFIEWIIDWSMKMEKRVVFNCFDAMERLFTRWMQIN